MPPDPPDPTDPTHPADPADPAAAGTILVPGTGRIAVQPDLADVRLGVAIVRPSVGDARDVAASTMTAILAAVADAGVEDRDVRTALLSIQPRYDHRGEQGMVLVGYELANVVEVVVRDLERLGAVIDGALDAGATSLDDLRFRVADPAPAERAARLSAMRAARERAETLAEAAGLALGEVVDIVEGAVGRPPVPYGVAEKMALAADVGTPVAAGSIEIAVEVRVRYRVR